MASLSYTTIPSTYDPMCAHELDPDMRRTFMRMWETELFPKVIMMIMDDDDDDIGGMMKRASLIFLMEANRSTQNSKLSKISCLLL